MVFYVAKDLPSGFKCSSVEAKGLQKMVSLHEPIFTGCYRTQMHRLSDGGATVTGWKEKDSYI